MTADQRIHDPTVVAGIGVISAVGHDAPSFWRALCAGECGITEVDLFDTADYRTHTGAQIKNFDLSQVGPRRSRKRLSRCDLLALTAADEALTATRVRERLAPESIGVAFGAGAGGMLSAERFREHDLLGQPADPNDLLPFPCGSTADWLGAQFGLRGPRATVVTACSSSATAIGLAKDWLDAGFAQAVLAGGADALSRLTYAGFNALRSVDPQPCRPFDAERKGLSLGECAAFLIMVKASTAHALGLTVYAELAGYAVGCDAYHMTAPETSADGAVRTIRSALQQSGVTPDYIDFVNAHGTATKFNDIAESKAVGRVFGARASALPVTANKSLVGHCLGAAGAIEAVATVLSVQQDIIPPTAHYALPDDQCPVNVVHGQALPHKIRAALSNSFAFGGNNTALVFRKHEEAAR